MNTPYALQIGYVAAILTTIGFLPQLIKLYKTKQKGNVSILTLMQYLIGNVLWVYYAIYIKSPVLLYPGIVCCMIIFATVVLWLHYPNNGNI